FRPGDLVLLRDIMNLAFVASPSTHTKRNLSTRKLVKKNSQISPRFLVNPGSYFDPGLQDLVRSAATKASISLQEGTYCWLRGPTYETASEIRMLGMFGADAVGMSTVPEIVAAKSLGMRVTAVSLISNLATGISLQKLSHQEVTETATAVRESFTSLMREVILRI
ncbi:MAG TPA: purine-nucleoside phosphorylase, partial [Bacteroidota bacterium]|nr:purine-nucleoside phosphorylase [Bacteroidota bacterium]